MKPNVRAQRPLPQSGLLVSTSPATTHFGSKVPKFDGYKRMFNIDDVGIDDLFRIMQKNVSITASTKQSPAASVDIGDDK
jgi:hypothetical protein